MLTGHFQVARSLCFKARLSAKHWYENEFFILMHIKLIFTREVLHLASLWKQEFLELESGLFIPTLRVAFSRVGWLSRAFAFRSLCYYPWGKMGDYSQSNSFHEIFIFLWFCSLNTSWKTLTSFRPQSILTFSQCPSLSEALCFNWKIKKRTVLLPPRVEPLGKSDVF